MRCFLGDAKPGIGDGCLPSLRGDGIEPVASKESSCTSRAVASSLCWLCAAPMVTITRFAELGRRHGRISSLAARPAINTCLRFQGICYLAACD